MANTLLSGCVSASPMGHQQAAQEKKNTVGKGNTQSMFSRVRNRRSGRTAVVPRLLCTQTQLRVEKGMGVCTQGRLLPDRKGKAEPWIGAEPGLVLSDPFVGRNAQKGS